MPALDFPASPTNGQVYQNWIYSTSKGAWQAKPLTGVKTITDDVAPLNPADGDQWFSTVDGVLYIYVVDVDGGQWVESRSAIISDGYYSPNYIINGGFDFWQRGTSFGAVNAYTADRWYSEGNNSTARGALGGSDASPVPGISNFVRITRTSNLSTFPSLAQRIEDVNNFAGQTITISFYARLNTAYSSGNWQFMYGQFFGSGGSTAVANYTAGVFTPTSSWKRFNLTITVPSIAGKTIGAGNFFLAGVRNDSATMTAGQLDITGFQVETGSVATPFRRSGNSIAEEFAACQRYYEKIMHQGVAGLVRGYGVSGQEWCDIKFFEVTKRVAPTITGGSFGGNVPTLDAITEMSYRVVFVPGSTGMWYYIANTGVYADAEL